MNTVFVFELQGEVTEGLATAAGSSKAERACLNPQDVGAHETETLFVSFDWAKQPKDLARAAGSCKAEVAHHFRSLPYNPNSQRYHVFNRFYKPTFMKFKKRVEIPLLHCKNFCPFQQMFH